MPPCSGRLEQVYPGLHRLPVILGSGHPLQAESEPDSRMRNVRVIAVSMRAALPLHVCPRIKFDPLALKTCALR